MPKLVLTVPETIESVTRPIVFDITRQLERFTGINPQETRIYFPGYMEKDRQPGSSISGTDPQNTFLSNPRITIEVDEGYEADRMLSSAVYRPENLFIFRDDRIETWIKPAYSSTEMVINYRFRATDRVEAMRWRDDIKTRVSMERGEFLHTLTYHYLIPQEFLYILKEIHRLRENVAPYGEDYPTFFKNNTSQRVSMLTNLNGSAEEWGVAESQMRVVGWFDFEGVPEIGSREDEDDTWTISFSYKFKFDKPVACVMGYPLMVHNQLLGSKFRPTEPVDQPEFHQRSYSLSIKDMAAFERPTQARAAAAMPGVAIPNFDEFIPEYILPSTLRIFTALTNIDTSNPSVLMNLSDLGGRWQINPDVLDFIKGEVPYLTQPYKSVFNVSLYQGIHLLEPNMVNVDASLNIVAQQALDLRQYYHVRLGLVSDWTLLDSAALDRLREKGNIALTLLDAIIPGFTPPDLLYGYYLRRNDLDALINATIGQARQFNTVMTLFIEAHKEQVN